MAAKRSELPKAEDNSRLQDYELVYIISPEFTDESLESKVEGISQFITSKEGDISEVERWGRRKLAYPVKHFLEGNYVLARFRINPARCKELEANLKISEEVLRYLLVRTGS